MTRTALTVAQRAVQALGYAEREKDLVDLAAKSATITKITNPDGYKQCHAARMVLKNTRVEIQARAKAAREDATAFSKSVIAEEKRLIAITETEEKRLEAIQDEWDAAIERERQAKIDAEMKRVSDLQERVTELRGSQALTSLNDSGLIAQHLTDLEGIEVDDSFQEFRQQAEDAKAGGVLRLKNLLAAAQEREAEQAKIKADREELARLRAEQEARDKAERARIAEEERKAKAERDAEAARHAEALQAEQARLAAERAEQERAIAAERARIAAEEKAAKAAREAEEQRLARERAEFERQQEESKKAREAEEKRQAEQARLAAMTPPSSHEIVDVLTAHYRVPGSKVIDWLLAIDFRAERVA
jgi:hypothetical protein